MSQYSHERSHQRVIRTRFIVPILLIGVIKQSKASKSKKSFQTMMKLSLFLRPCVRAAAACRQLSTTTKPIKLYGFPMSQPVRSVLLLCNSADIKYDFVLVNALKGEHLKPDFKKIHPAGLLPAIEEDGLGVMGECSAILVYLAETRKLEQWYPSSDPIKRAHINFFLSWHHGNTRVATSGLIRNKMFPPKGASL